MLNRRLSPKSTQKIAMTFIWGAGIITLLILLMIIAFVLVKGLPGLSWSFLTTAPEGGLSGAGGISTVIVSTIYLLALTLAVLVVPGIGAAIYLNEYAPQNRFTHLIRYGIDTLAGIPSIVFGLFGFALFVTVLHFNFSILSGALTLACLLLPTLIRTTEEAIKVVPRSDREASLALGATKWQTIRYVVLPAAMPGIVTGVILCVGRAISESACLFITMGGSAAMPTSLLSGGRTLAIHMYYLSSETNNITGAMATGAVLIIAILITNTITNWLSHRFHKKMAGRT